MLTTEEKMARYSQLSFPLEAELGRCEMSVSEILSLAPGNVLTLDRTFEDTLPYLFALLGIGEGEELPVGIQFCRMAPSILTQQTGFPC